MWVDNTPEDSEQISAREYMPVNLKQKYLRLPSRGGWHSRGMLPRKILTGVSSKMAKNASVKICQTQCVNPSII